jgi:hypothetical protein
MSLKYKPIHNVRKSSRSISRQAERMKKTAAHKAAFFY